jgi:hypothetical protein
LFGGAWLAGDFGEADVAGIGEAATADGECGDGLVFGRALEDDGVQILDAAREVGFAAERVVEFFDAFVDGGGALEIETVAGFFALDLDGSAQRIAVGVEELHEAIYFGVVFLFGAAGEAGGEAHLHFGVEAAGERGVAADFDLATADFEKIEDAIGEGESVFAGGVGAVVGASGWGAGGVDGDAAGDDAARVGVAQRDF